uniref:Ovule protein n=1 Tax=Strongyloides venezuelensis TaxID=75913 RepID=A0A0K0FUQ3_STRVS
MAGRNSTINLTHTSKFNMYVYHYYVLNKSFTTQIENRVFLAFPVFFMTIIFKTRAKENDLYICGHDQIIYHTHTTRPSFPHISPQTIFIPTAGFLPPPTIII